MAANQSALGQITLITGPEEFLGERTVQRLRTQVRNADPEADFTQTQAASVDQAALEELSAPSLFSATRCVVVHQLEQLPEESWQGLLDYCSNPVADVALILVHTGGNRGSGLLNKLRKCDSVNEFKSAVIKAYQLPDFVVSEAKSRKVVMGNRAAGSWCSRWARICAPWQLPLGSWRVTSQVKSSPCNECSSTTVAERRRSLLR